MQLNFFVLRSDQMEHDMASKLAYALPIAEPFITAMMQAPDNGLHIVHATIRALVRRQIIEVVGLDCSKIDALALVLAIDGTRDFTELVIRKVLKTIIASFKLIKLLIEVISIVKVLRTYIALIVETTDCDVVLRVESAILSTTALLLPSILALVTSA